MKKTFNSTNLEVSVIQIEKTLKMLLLQQKNILSLREAAEYIGVQINTLHKYTSKGIIKFSKPRGKNIYFEKRELDRWLLSQQGISDEEINKLAANYISAHPQTKYKKKFFDIR